MRKKNTYRKKGPKFSRILLKLLVVVVHSARVLRHLFGLAIHLRLCGLQFTKRQNYIERSSCSQICNPNIYSPFDLIELRVVFLHPGPDPSDPLPEDHVGLRRHLPPGGAHLLVVILNWKFEELA